MLKLIGNASRCRKYIYVLFREVELGFNEKFLEELIGTFELRAIPKRTADSAFSGHLLE